jgi:hypothetical protein
MSESDSYGGGADRYYYLGNGRVSVTGNNQSVSASLSNTSYYDSYNLSFTAPTGKTLEVGEYERVNRYPDPVHAGMYVSGYSYYCSTSIGRFRVNEITFGPDGKVTSAWIFFEHHCEGSTSATYGEVRYNIEGDPGQAVLSQRMMRWRNTDPSRPMHVMPVRVWNPGPGSLEFEPSSIQGTDTDEFNVRVDGCKDAVLQAHEFCHVYVRYTPLTSGFKEATLEIPESSGEVHRTALSGYVYPGNSRFYYKRTKLSTNSYVQEGQGQYDTSNADIYAWGGPKMIGATVQGDDGVQWSLRFYPKQGDVLVPGEPVENVEGTDYYENGLANARISVGMNNYSYDDDCADNAFFQVHSMSVDGTGQLEKLAVTFDQPCGQSYAHHGMFEFRVSDLMDRGGTAPLTANVTGPGEIVSTAGSAPCRSSCTEDHPWGNSVTVTAVPDPEHVFTGWTGACKGVAPCTIRMAGHRTVGATFVRRAQILTVTKSLETHASGTVTSDPEGIACGTDCSQSYQRHHEIDLTAVAGPRSEFMGWSGGCTGTDPTCSVVMSQDKTVTARFELTQYRVRVEKSGSGSGRVTSSPAGINCGDECLAMFPDETPITLTADPASDSVFRGFGPPCGDALTCTFTPTEDTEVHARFKLATTASVSVADASTGYVAAGSLEPRSASSTGRLTLTQLRRNGDVYNTQSWKQELDGRGRFSRVIGEKPMNRCTLKFSFAGNKRYAGSSDTTTFSC